MKTRYQHPQAHYVATTGASLSTVKRWQKSGVPLDDPDALAHWATTQKSLPLAMRERFAREAVPKNLIMDVDLAQGAAGALRRLEEAEATHFADYQDAIKADPPNPARIKAAREAWLKIGDSLRRYDLLVEQNRRDSGDLMPRAQVEQVVRAFTWYLRIAGQQACISLAGRLAAEANPAACNQLLTEVLWEQILTACAGLASHGQKEMEVPEWLVKAFSHDLNNVFSDVDQVIESRAATIRAGIDAIAGPGSAPKRRRRRETASK